MSACTNEFVPQTPPSSPKITPARVTLRMSPNNNLETSKGAHAAGAIVGEKQVVAKVINLDEWIPNQGFRVSTQMVQRELVMEVSAEFTPIFRIKTLSNARRPIVS